MILKFLFMVVQSSVILNE